MIVSVRVSGRDERVVDGLTMNPALYVAPARKMINIHPQIPVGSSNVSISSQCNKGTGTHKMARVANPMSEVKKLACSAMGR